MKKKFNMAVIIVSTTILAGCGQKAPNALRDEKQIEIDYVNQDVEETQEVTEEVNRALEILLETVTEEKRIAADQQKKYTQLIISLVDGMADSVIRIAEEVLAIDVTLGAQVDTEKINMMNNVVNGMSTTTSKAESFIQFIEEKEETKDILEALWSIINLFEDVLYGAGTYLDLGYVKEMGRPDGKCTYYLGYLKEARARLQEVTSNY